ncbi:retrotransposon protein, putative, ty1-copia subclass [Tanacetum coccineum]
MCNYLKNIAGFTHNQLKSKSFDEVQKAFDKTMSWIDSFVPMDSEVVKDRAEGSETRTEGSSKRTGEELQKESTKKQKVDEEKESEELKKCLEIVPDDGDDVTIDATPLSTKSPTIVDFEIHQEGKKSYFQIIREDVQSIQYFLLVEKMYPLTKHTLHQMFNDVKLQVGYECEMAYELLRLLSKIYSSGINNNEVAPIEVEPQNVGVPIRRSARIPQVTNRYGYYIDVEEYELGDLDEPPNYKAALADPESDKWLEAMNTKMQSKDNLVWYLVDLPSNGQTIGCKWLFKKKTDIDGNVHTFKARLVAKGFTQTYGGDYEKTFSLVANIRAIRILLAIAAFYDYEIWQMDFKTAFLNGHLSEDLYMVQPEGFVDPKYPNKVCKLQCSIYELKQASRSWNKRFDVEIKKIGFTQYPDEPCVYLTASGSNVAFLVFYVDDILLMGNSVTMLQEVKSWLFKCFSIKDLGEAAYILGIKIIHDRSKWLIALSQSAYLEKILKKFRMENSKKSHFQQNPVDWKSAKQSTTAMSSIEVEYIVA